MIVDLSISNAMGSAFTVSSYAKLVNIKLDMTVIPQLLGKPLEIF